MFANSKSKAKLAQHLTIPNKKIKQHLTDINQCLTNVSQF